MKPIPLQGLLTLEPQLFSSTMQTRVVNAATGLVVWWERVRKKTAVMGQEWWFSYVTMTSRAVSEILTMARSLQAKTTRSPSKWWADEKRCIAMLENVTRLTWSRTCHWTTSTNTSMVCWELIAQDGAILWNTSPAIFRLSGAVFRLSAANRGRKIRPTSTQ